MGLDKRLGKDGHSRGRTKSPARKGRTGMADKRISEEPKSARERAADRAMQVLMDMGASAVIVLASWDQTNEDGNTEVTAAHNPGRAARRHLKVVRRIAEDFPDEG